MAKCSECGFENPANMETCLNCGASLKREKLGQAIDDISEDATIMIGRPLRVSAPPPPPSSTGKPMQPAAPVAQAPPAPPAPPAPQKPAPPPAQANPNTLLYIIIAAASAVATLVVVLILKIVGVF